MSLLAFSTPQSAQAQTSGGHSWQIVYTQTGTWGYADRDMPTTGQSTGYNGVWPTTGNGYEIGGGGQINGSLTNATITATLTWIPATGKTLQTDPPPSPLNIIEYGYAWCATNWGSPDMPDPSSALADDGLGDTPPASSSNGYNTWTVTSQGYHAVQKDASSGTVTVTCSPSASNPSSSYLLHSTYPNYYYWDWTQGLSSVSFTVYPVTPNPSVTIPDGSGNLDILVGQGCSASLSGIPSALLNNATNPPTYSWNVSGNTFQDWEPTTPALPNATPPTPANPNASYYVPGSGVLTNPTAHWFWNEAQQTSETVSCTAMLTPPARQGAAFSVTPTQKVIVQVPGWTADGNGGYMEVNSAAPNAGGAICLWAGPQAGQIGGMNWTASCTTPQTPVAFGTGTVELVQTATPNRSYVTGGATRNDPENGKNGLDTAYPYQGPAYTEGGSLYKTNDNPYMSLSNSITSATLTDSFADWLMYQPPSNGNGVQWVPRGTFTWSTNGSATIPRTGNWADYATQHGSDSAGTVTPNTDTPFTAGNTFPAWTRINVFPSF